MSDPVAGGVLPEPLSMLDVRVEGDTMITVRRHGNPDGVRLVLSHGNGLSIDLYYPFWSLLEEDFDLFVYDLRNHGRNTLGALENHNVPTIARDQDTLLEAIEAGYGVKPTVGVFHSVSALTTLLSPSNGSGFEALFLFDPPLRKPGVSHEEFDEASIRAAARARRRAHRFPTREAYLELLEFSPNFRRVVPGVLPLVAETTLRESAPGGGYELICPPEFEAVIVEYGRIFSAFVDVSSVSCPTKVYGADPTLPYAYLPTLDLGDIEEVDYDFLPDATHFLQLEQPETCVATLREFLEQRGCL